jgi:arsenate reductase (thioredoxin)
MKKQKVLFLCTGNSARSQMAEAYLRNFGADLFAAYSAGLEPQEINPLTRKVMAEAGVSMEGQYAKDLSEYLGREHFSFLITVCSNAEQRCPSAFPGIGERIRWVFDDPAAEEGSEEQKLVKFRQVRDQIAEQVRKWAISQELS